MPSKVMEGAVRVNRAALGGVKWEPGLDGGVEKWRRNTFLYGTYSPTHSQTRKAAGSPPLSEEGKAIRGDGMACAIS